LQRRFWGSILFGASAILLSPYPTLRLGASPHSPESFIVVIFVTIIIQIILDFFGGNPVAFLNPGAEIDQPAAIGTKRPVRVIVPGRFVAASRAL